MSTKIYKADSFQTMSGESVVENLVEKVTGSSLVPNSEIEKLAILDPTSDLQKPVSTLQEARIQEVVEAQITNSTIIEPTATLPPTGNFHAIGAGEGIYPNWGGMEIPANNIGTLQRVDGIYSVSLTEIILTGYLKKESVNNEIVFNSSETKQVKIYGDWKTGEALYFKVKNLAITTTGSFNAQLWDWDNSTSLAVSYTNEITKVILNADTTTIGLHLNLTGTVTSAYSIMGLYDSVIATNASNIALNTFEISLSKLNNGLKIAQNTAQKIIKLGIIEAGSYLRLEVENINIITTGAFNFQVYQLSNDTVLGILYNNGIVDVPVLEIGEIWIVANITGTITVAEYDIKLTSSLSAIEDRNIKSVVKFQNKEDFGFNYDTTGYAAFPSLALFSYENANANKEGILQKITLNVAVTGTFTFAIGSLDQRNWAIISKEFNVSTNATGKQTFDVSDKFLTIGLNDYLFVYTKKNGTETVNWKSYPTANSNPNFIFGDPSGEILPFAGTYGGGLVAGTYGGGLVFSWDIIPFESYFASKKDLNTVTTEIANVSAIANTAYNSIAKVSDLDGNLYKMIVVDGVITLQALDFQRVMVIGNSLLTGLAGRGLACTVPANDFASKLLVGIQVKYAPATMTKIPAANWERDLSTDSGTFDALFADASGLYDLIVIRLGENVNDIPNLQDGIEGMIDYLKADYPLATFLVTSTVLDFTISAKNTALSTAASNKGVNYVAINGSTDNYRIGTSRMYTNGSNVIVPSDYTILTHSNDLGFLFTANSMLNAVGYEQLNDSYALDVTATVDADYPVLGVQGGIISIKTYGGSAPTISVNGGAISVTHYQLSTFTYDNRLINGVADTATYVSTFTMPASAVTVTIN